MSEPAWVPIGGAPATVVPLVTELPASPFDGQEVVFVDSLAAPTYSWRLRYVAAKATNKWVFIGGAPAISTVMTAQTLASANSYLDLATVGPQFTIPVAGIYSVDFTIRATATADYQNGDVTVKVGAAAASDVDSMHQHPTNTGASPETSTHLRAPEAFAAGTVLKLQYKATATWTFADRKMRVVPIAVGG